MSITDIPISLQLEKWKYLEDLIFEPTIENINSAVEKMRGKNQESNIESFFMMIIVVSKVRRFSFHYLSNLWSRIPLSKNDFPQCEFTEYLYKRELLDSKQISGFSEPLKDVSILESGNTDNLELFDYIKTDNTEKVIEISAYNTTMNIQIHFDDDFISPICFSALCGSTNVFKFLFMNQKSLAPYTLTHIYNCTTFSKNYVEFQIFYEKSDKQLPSYAIRGGNQEIITILIQSNYMFNNKLRDAFLYHRNDIALWLLNNYRCEKLTLQTVIPFYNTLAFSYVLNRTKDINNDEDKTHKFPLNIAVEWDHLPFVKILLDNDADPTCGDELQSLPLAVAAKNGYYNIAKTLLNKCDNETRYYTNQNPFLIASLYCKKDIMQLLLDNCPLDINVYDETHSTALMLAAENGDEEIVSYLLSRGADCDLVDINNQSALFRAIKSENPEILRILLQAGSDPNQMDDHGNTPLIYCALYSKNSKFMKYLLYFGADPNLTNDKEWSPLIAAAISNIPEHVKILLEFDVDIEHKDSVGANALWYAVRFQNKAIETMIFEKMAQKAIENKDDE